MNKNEKLTYLKTALLQQDMRIRMPKCIIENMNSVKGETEFDIYINKDKDKLILKIKNKEDDKE